MIWIITRKKNNSIGLYRTSSKVLKSEKTYRKMLILWKGTNTEEMKKVRKKLLEGGIKE